MTNSEIALDNRLSYDSRSSIKTILYQYESLKGLSKVGVNTTAIDVCVDIQAAIKAILKTANAEQRRAVRILMLNTRAEYTIDELCVMFESSHGRIQRCIDNTCDLLLQILNGGKTDAAA